MRPCFSLVPCSPVLCPLVLWCRVALWCPVLLPFLVCFLCLFGFSYLKKLLLNLFKIKKNFFLKIKKNYTRPNTPASSKTMYASASYVLPVDLDVRGLVLVLGVVDIIGVHC